MNSYMKIYLWIIFSLIIFPSKAQKPEPSIGEVVYDFYHITDTTQPGKVYNEKMALIFGKESSEYLSQTNREQEEYRKEKIAEAEQMGSHTVNLGVVRKVTKSYLFSFPNIDKLFILTQFRQNKYLVQDSLPKINWKITRETKYIKNYKCQQAIGYWRGRNYTAWFSTDLPYFYGPWKLNGLPGLILEAKDDKNEVGFVCDSILIPNNSGMIHIPGDAIVTNEDTFQKMIKATSNLSISEGAGNSETRISKVEIQKNGSIQTHGTTMNNPIEKYR